MRRLVLALGTTVENDHVKSPHRDHLKWQPSRARDRPRAWQWLSRKDSEPDSSAPEAPHSIWLERWLRCGRRALVPVRNRASTRDDGHHLARDDGMS